jgi:hypothetical protein
MAVGYERLVRKVAVLEGFMKYIVNMATDLMIYMPSFMKIVSSVQAISTFCLSTVLKGSMLVLLITGTFEVHSCDGTKCYDIHSKQNCWGFGLYPSSGF